MKKIQTLKITYAALCLALALVLPFLTGQIPQIGNALCPMHIPVFLCGFLCGGPYGMVVGFIAPILRYFVFGMPVLMPAGVGMAFELATYGLVSGVLYKKLEKTNLNVYFSLVAAMVIGRIVWGIVRFAIAGFSATEFPLSAFLSGAVLNAVPGIIVHIVLIPVIVIGLKKAKIGLNE